MKVTAKFYVTSIKHLHTQSPDYVCAEIVLAPVYAGKDGNPANADWSKATPQGEIKMTVTNPAAIERFNLGANYFVEFMPTD